MSDLTLRQHLELAAWSAECGRSADVTKDIEDALAILNRAERVLVQCGVTGAKEYEIPGERILITDPLPDINVRSDPAGFTNT